MASLAGEIMVMVSLTGFSLRQSFVLLAEADHVGKRFS